jgi:hypothetical protein
MFIVVDSSPQSEREKDFYQLREDLGKSVTDGRTLYLWYAHRWRIHDWSFFLQREPVMYRRTEDALEYFLDQEWYEEMIILQPIFDSLRNTGITCMSRDEYHDHLYEGFGDGDDD